MICRKYFLQELELEVINFLAGVLQKAEFQNLVYHDLK